MHSQFRLLSTRRFLPLFITQFFGAFNDNAFKNALIIWYTFIVAKQDTALSAELMVNLAAGLLILPFFLFSSLAGEFADKYDKAWLARRLKFIEIVLMIIGAGLFWLGHLYGLLLIVFLLGMQSSFFGPIKYGILPEQLQENELVGGNGIIEAGTFVSILLGTLFGGLVIALPNGIIWLSAMVISLAIIGWISALYIPLRDGARHAEPMNWNIIKATKELIIQTYRQRSIWLSILAISWFWTLGSILLAQFPLFIERVINGDNVMAVYMMALFSIGVATGSLLCHHLLKGEINLKYVIPGLIGVSITLSTVIIASLFWQRPPEPIGMVTFLQMGALSFIIIGGIFLLSAFSGLYVVPLYALIQAHAPQGFVARIIASNNIINSFFMVVGSVIAVLFYQAGFDVLDIFIFGASVNILLVFVVRRILSA